MGGQSLSSGVQASPPSQEGSSGLRSSHPWAWAQTGSRAGCPGTLDRASLSGGKVAVAMSAVPHPLCLFLGPHTCLCGSPEPLGSRDYARKALEAGVLETGVASTGPCSCGCARRVQAPCRGASWSSPDCLCHGDPASPPARLALGCPGSRRPAHRDVTFTPHLSAGRPGSGCWVCLLPELGRVQEAPSCQSRPGAAREMLGF